MKECLMFFQMISLLSLTVWLSFLFCGSAGANCSNAHTAPPQTGISPPVVTPQPKVYPAPRVPISPNVSAIKAQCQQKYDYRMSLVANHYDPLMNAEKVKIEELRIRADHLSKINPRSVALQGTINMIHTKMGHHALEHSKLRLERIKRENKIKADFRDDLNRARGIAVPYK
jgi:hypothetical protein